ncbi:ABC transporter permease [Bacillus sp. DJP31]|uniref:ABC transporter permease n=1 Tax=Bacillus sp. DJP31 TaxID=3409789 RepID=UPI003BB5BBBB
MGNLIINEWVKVFRRTGTIVMLVILALGVLAVGAFMKYDENQNPPGENTEWKQELEAQLIEERAAIEQTDQMNAGLKMFYEREIAIKEYRIRNDIPPQTEQNVWSFVREAQGLITFVGLFTIIIAAGIVSSEFSWGTIKLLLIRPLSRSKILLSKYITVLLFGGLLLAIIFTLSAVVGLVLFGLPTNEVPHLAFMDGEVVERNIVLHLIVQYLLSSIDVLMVATMAFMISAVFRNNSLAIGISLFLLLMGGTATMLLASKFEWAKYFLFANTDLNVYFDGVPPVDGMTLSFSIVMLIVYYVVFQLLSFFVFAKRDVAA